MSKDITKGEWNQQGISTYWLTKSVNTSGTLSSIIYQPLTVLHSFFLYVRISQPYSHFHCNTGISDDI